MNKLESLLADLVSGDEPRAERSVSALLELGEEALPALLDLTKSSNADSRWWALRALAIAPRAQTEWLIPFLEDPAPEVRQCAALGLSEKAGEAAIQPLVRALSDDDAMVGDLAAKALIRIGKPAVSTLIEAAQSESQPVRIYAVRALAEIRDYRAIPALMRASEEDSALLSYWAQIGLERLGLDMIYLKPV